ncbi:MAG TPA: DUF2141 domain-containing protein, partial [Gemmatimonadales bacterium]|nr:DUF2141 domain-containing protein [Gemmatimonadales bacterium]
MRRSGGLVLGWCLLAAPLAGQAEGADRGSVTVTITGISAEQAGTLLVALYDHASAWLILDSARAVRRIPVAADSATAVFDSLPTDTGYAIAVIHDRNGNDKLDMRWFPFPKPKEGAGVSNDHVRMGRPR